MKLGPEISVVVAGGASGLGAAAAEALAARGCKVAILDSYRDKGEALAEKIGAVYYNLEISSEITVDVALQFAAEKNGVPRLLINCAGVAIEQPSAWRDKGSGEIKTHDVTSFERLLQVNLTGTFYLATRCAKQMMSLAPVGGNGERGLIINSASVAAEDGFEGQAAYAASEGGVLALTRPMARDFLDDGIRVVTIMPGRYDTVNFTERSEDMRQKVGTHEEVRDGMSDPKEFADAVMRICEDEGINGQCIRLSGAKAA